MSCAASLESVLLYPRSVLKIVLPSDLSNKANTEVCGDHKYQNAALCISGWQKSFLTSVYLSY